MRKLFCLFGLFAISFSASAAGEWLYYKHYPWVYDNVSKDWLYLRGAADGSIYAYRSNTNKWEAFTANQIATTFNPENPPSRLNIELNASVNLEMIWVEPGTFLMGSPEGDSYDGTQTQVTITNGFYLGRFETTGSQYEAVMDGNSYGIPTKPSTSHFSYINRSAFPVETVSRTNVEKFMTILNDLLASDIPLGWAFKLPTEAEWEYSCRAGSTTAFSWGNTISYDDANFYDPNSPLERTKEPGQYNPNAWGFYDMHGNVMEWCEDNIGSLGVVRGGGTWNHIGRGDYSLLRSAARFSWDPNNGAAHLGFRIALKPSGTKDDDVIPVPTWDEQYEEWILDPEPYGGLEVLEQIKEAKESRHTRLELGRKNITDISTLTGFTNLTYLVLYSNSISDLSPLAGLTNLRVLDLRFNKISNLSPLAGLTNLWELWLQDNNISDISPLAGLTNLEDLQLDSNSISDLSPLAGLTSLDDLQLNKNNISDISPLAGLTNLTELRLHSNSISDLSPLTGLSNLWLLSLSNNNVSDLTPLAGFTNLKSLWLDFNNFLDIAPLAELTSLTYLSLRQNTIRDSQKAMLEEALPNTNISW